MLSQHDGIQSGLFVPNWIAVTYKPEREEKKTSLMSVVQSLKASPAALRNSFTVCSRVNSHDCQTGRGPEIEKTMYSRANYLFFNVEDKNV